MDRDRIRDLLERVRDGETPVNDALRVLRTLPFEDLGFAKLDHHRALRSGFPEVVYCPGKTTEQILTIIDRLGMRSAKVLATRASQEVAEAVCARFPHVQYHRDARILAVAAGAGDDPPTMPAHSSPGILVVSAGTADLPVAEEAAVTATEMGSRVDRLYDVGVAGIHRLFSHQEQIFTANVLIVVAGMEGALASVVGGLVARPVIAVPTSVGYGASFQGLAALLTMLNSCASGVGVVNIDNGFGAGYLAHLINAAPDVPQAVPDAAACPER